MCDRRRRGDATNPWFGNLRDDAGVDSGEEATDSNVPRLSPAVVVLICCITGTSKETVSLETSSSAGNGRSEVAGSTF